jgi:hypothetical protein
VLRRLETVFQTYELHLGCILHHIEGEESPILNNLITCSKLCILPLPYASYLVVSRHAYHSLLHLASSFDVPYCKHRLLGSLLHLGHASRCSLDNIFLVPDGQSTGKFNNSLGPLSSVWQSLDRLLERRRKKVAFLGESKEADQERCDDSL